MRSNVENEKKSVNDKNEENNLQSQTDNQQIVAPESHQGSELEENPDNKAEVVSEGISDEISEVRETIRVEDNKNIALAESDEEAKSESLKETPEPELIKVEEEAETESIKETLEPELIQAEEEAETESIKETLEPELIQAEEKVEVESLNETPEPEPIKADEEAESESLKETPEPEQIKAEKKAEAENLKEVEDSKPIEDKEIEIDYELEDANEEEEESDDADDDESQVDDDDETTLHPIDEIVEYLRNQFETGSLKRKNIEEYKNQFYRSLRNEIETQKQRFLSEGGEELDFIANEPEIYREGKELLQKIKEKRAELLVKENAQKEKNVARKLSIINQIKVLTETQGHEDFNKIYQEFRSLQNEWNEIKLIPQSKVNELWKSYQRYVEKFYDLVRINNEFREYDFKKNLELKSELCEAAERLADESDVVSAFHQLQNLHQEWRETGPVSRRDREEIWNRFKTASTVINKKYQTHFEALRDKEDENLELKSSICEKIEAIDYSKIKTIKDWNRNVKEVLELQSQWRQIGFVPRKWNTKIYKRYRAACDLFFKTKNEFYKSLRGEMEENLKIKLDLCERAEAMKDSQDWKKTTQYMIDIQKEWKSVGIVPRKHVDALWKRFISACDYFFEQKKLHSSSRYEEELLNMEAKNAIVESIKNIDKSISTDKALPILRELMNEWYAVGHVPYKMKDISYRQFYNATEAEFERLNIDKADRMLESFKTNIGDMAKSANAKNQLLHEREKLMRQYERIKGELQTYENNIGFLSVSSKKGNHLIDDMNQKIEKIKSELELIVRKVEAVDREL